MPLPQVLVLALVQGVAEFLPISSTAHLYLASWLFGWKPQDLDFDISLHLGTLLALVLYFLPDWIRTAAGAFSGASGPPLFWLLALGSVPVGIAGLAFKRQAAHSWRNPRLMAVMLILVGIVMGLADRSIHEARGLASLGLPDAMTVGISQILALVPGTSRSGITITAGLFRGFSREAAARFSFLLATPVIAAAAGHMLYAVHKRDGLRRMANPEFLLAMAVSAGAGVAVIAGFLYYLRRADLRPFVYYRVISGIIVFALASIRRPAG